MPGKPWNPVEEERLRLLAAKGLSAREMSIGGRSTAAIQNKAARLKVLGDCISRRHWPAEDEQQLRRLLEAGWTPKQIAASGHLAGYSHNAIIKKSTRLGLADPERSERAREAQRLDDSQLELFHRFLRAHASNCTPEQIALLWNERYDPPVSRRKVVYHLEQLKLKRPWQQVIRMPFSRAKRRGEPRVGPQNGVRSLGSV